MNIQIRMTEEIKEMPVDALEIAGNKGVNAIKRFGCRTIEDVVSCWSSFKQAKGIGVETQLKIQNAVVNLMIQYLPDSELVEWFKYMIENNSAEDLRGLIEGFEAVKTEQYVA